MDGIELRLFRYFVALCEERHFGRAAERLNISVPTLSNQLKKLEKQLETQLIRRKGKSSIEITEPGKRFRDSAVNVLHQASEAELTVRQAARGEVGRIAVGFMVSTAYSGIMQRCIGGFRRAHPAIDMSLHQMSTVKVLSSLLSNEIDVGFAREPKQYPLGITGFVIYRQSTALAIPADHPLAKKGGPIYAEDLANETFVSTSVAFDMSFKRHVETIAKLGGFTPRVGKRAEDLTTVITYVSAGFGIGIVSTEMMNCQIPNVVFKKLSGKGALPEVVIAFMHREREPSPACRALIEAMRAFAVPANTEPKLLRPMAI